MAPASKNTMHQYWCLAQEKELLAIRCRVDTIDPVEAGLECECIESLNKHGIAIRYRKTYVEVETTRWSNQ